MLDDFRNFYSGLYSVKNAKSEFIWLSNDSVKLTGLNNYQRKTDFDLPCDAAEFAPTFQEQDQAAIAAGSILTVDVQYYNTGLNTLFSEKKALWHEGELFGISSNSIVIPNNEIISQIADIDFSYHKNPIGTYYVGFIPKTKKELTTREQEVLFFTIRGQSAKSVANKLGISARTVEFHVENLKTKFNASNKEKLIEAAIANGYLKIIPKSILRIQN